VKAVQTIYPDHNWQLWKFTQAGKSFWTEPANRKKYFDQLKNKLGILSAEDWYQVSTKQIEEHGGSELLNTYYGGSLIEALKQNYPEIQWQPWRFQELPIGIWKSIDHKKYFEWIAKEFGIQRFGKALQIVCLTTSEDWYNIRLQDINNKGGGTLIAQFYGGSLPLALQAIYTEYPCTLSICLP
jgi:hypothetical protein